jgi:hypothetical protein
MEDVEFSDDFCRFLQTSIPAVEAAEILLYLRRNADRGHSVRDIAAGLKPGTSVSEADAEKHLDGLRARDLVALDAEKRARFQPATDALRAHSDNLAVAYTERPVTLIRMIYALRDSKIKTFADAFRIKR